MTEKDAGPWLENITCVEFREGQSARLPRTPNLAGIQAGAGASG